MDPELLIAGAIVFLAGMLVGMVITWALTDPGEGGEPDNDEPLFPPPEWANDLTLQK